MNTTITTCYYIHQKLHKPLCHNNGSVQNCKIPARTEFLEKITGSLAVPSVSRIGHIAYNDHILFAEVKKTKLLTPHLLSVTASWGRVKGRLFLLMIKRNSTFTLTVHAVVCSQFVYCNSLLVGLPKVRLVPLSLYLMLLLLD